MPEEVDCRTCGKRKQKYQECLGKEWYDFGDIRFCPHQIIWILENEETIGEGQWPYSPIKEKEIAESEEARIASLGKVATISHASYSTAGSDKIKDILYEVEVRLERLGKTMRELLLLHLKAGEPMSQEVKLAFHYITGLWRKVDSYPHWKANRKWYKKGKNTQI